MEISVIIVNYNTRKLLKDCLGSLYEKIKDLQMEVIVVDNGSTDGSVEDIKKLKIKNGHVKFKYILNDKNLGFAKANNQALEKACGKYILLLNSDTLLVEDSLTTMIDFLQLHPKVGISSCQLIDDNGQIQPSGGFFPTLPRVFAWMFFLDDLPLISKHIKSFHPHTPGFFTKDLWYKKEHIQDWVTGAFFLMRKQVKEEIGKLDENFFMYVEEMEYCYRAKKAGWLVAYTPRTKVIHLGGQSGPSKKALLAEYQGLKYFFSKHKNKWELLVLRVLLKIGAIYRVLIFGIIKSDRQMREIYVEAFFLA